MHAIGITSKFCKQFFVNEVRFPECVSLRQNSIWFIGKIEDSSDHEFSYLSYYMNTIVFQPEAKLIFFGNRLFLR